MDRFKFFCGCVKKSSSNKQGLAKVEVSRSDFETVNAIGRGGFGKVLRVRKDNRQYAMKEMLKTRVLAKKSIESVMMELEIMGRIDSNHIVNIIWAFHDKDYLYLVMDLMEGGDLRWHMIKNYKFNHE
jgi:serine/threonine protein kinase